MKKNKEKIIFNVIVSIFIIFFCFMITPFTFQNDTYYTIKIGETISQQGIDMLDHYSWHENLSYTYPHWLFDYITYQVYLKGGYLGIYLMTCILSSLVGLSLYFVNYKLSKNNIISFFVTIFSMFLIFQFITARAQIVTYSLFILTIYFIEKFLENRKLINVIALFCISVAIANIHIAVWPFFFVLFLPHIGAEIVAYFGDKLATSNSEIKSYLKELAILEKENSNSKKIQEYKEIIATLEEKRKDNINRRNEQLKNPYKIIIKRNKNVKWLVLVMVICILSAFISPLGAKTTFSYLINTMNGDTTHYISEHQPSALLNNFPLAFTLLLVFLLLTFTKNKIELSDLFLIGGLILLSILSNRQASLLVLLSSYIITKMISNSTFNINNEKTDNIVSNLIKHPILLIYTFLFVVGIGSSILQKNSPIKFVDDTKYPIQAVDFIKNNLDIKNIRLFNEYDYGSYLLLNDIPVFIDSRADLYSPEFNSNCTVFDDFMETESGKVYFEDIFEKYDITHIILSKKGALYTYVNRADNGKYKEIYSDDNFGIFERIVKNNNLEL